MRFQWTVGNGGAADGGEGRTMSLQSTSSSRSCRPVESEERIVDRLRGGRTLTVEELINEVPELSWVQLFMAMDQLSRRGDIDLRRHGFTYTVALKRSAQQAMRGMGGVDGTAPHDHR